MKDSLVIVSGDAGPQCLAVLAAATLAKQPCAYAGGQGPCSVRLDESTPIVGVVGALLSFVQSTSKGGLAAAAQQVETVSWATQSLFGKISDAGVSEHVAKILSASGSESDSVASLTIAAAFHGAAASSSSEVQSFVTKMQQHPAYVAAVKALSAPNSAYQFLVASTATAAGKGDKGGKRKAEDGGAEASSKGGEGAAPKEARAKGGKAPATAGGADALATLLSSTTAAPLSPSEASIMTSSVLHTLQSVFTAALHAAFPQAAAAGIGQADVVLNTAPNMYHHYQCNSALSVYPKLKGPSAPKEKKGGAAAGEGAAPAPAPAPAPVPAPASAAASGPVPASPKAVADALIAAVHASGPHWCIGKLECSGPGYINIYLPWNMITARLAHVLTAGQPTAGPLGGVDKARRVIVDYSSPNIAKDMHIGHLRSTIIGDTISRILEYCGHGVARINHVGDWGTQFGMLIAYLKELLASGTVKDDELDANISDLTAFYKASKKRFDADADFKARAHLEVVALQAGDATNLALWKRMVAVSSKMFSEVYQRLGIDERLALQGESFYNPLLAAVLAELQAKGLLKEEPGPEGSTGTALVQWVPGQEVPLMVRKSDGGYGYDSTDLAALKYRLFEQAVPLPGGAGTAQGGDWLIYVVDAGQSLHFDLCFAGARQAGWYTPEGTTPSTPGAKVARVEHCGFGVVLGEDGKKFKTRDGGVVRLVDVLDEAKSRALALIQERIATGNTPLTAQEAEHSAAVLGYGGVKYFDLRQNRLSDYAFSYTRMLSPDGDTAVYLEYAHARMASILRKAKEAHGVAVESLLTGLSTLDDAGRATAFTIAHPSEAGLAAELTRWQEVMTTFQQDLMPHRLCEYQYFLCGRFTDFFRDCPVLQSDVPPALRDARLRLVAATEATVACGMKLLGIEPLDKI